MRRIFDTNKNIMILLILPCFGNQPNKNRLGLDVASQEEWLAATKLGCGDGTYHPEYGQPEAGPDRDFHFSTMTS